MTAGRTSCQCQALPNVKPETLLAAVDSKQTAELLIALPSHLHAGSAA